MRRTRLAGWLAAAALAILVTVLAPPGTVAPPRAFAQITVTSPIDVVVVLDDSGSMATCAPWIDGRPVQATNCDSSNKQNPPSDPDALRYSAARLLMQLAEDDDRIAVIRFDSKAERLIPELTRVGGPDTRAALAARLRPPSPVPDGYLERAYTRIDLGMQEAATLLAEGQSSRPQYVLFLTDGEPKQPKDDRSDQRAAVQQTVKGLRAQGVEVFPVLLCNVQAGCSGDARAFLSATIGREPTIANDARDIVREFGTLFAAMKPNLTLIQPDLNGDLVWKTRGPQGPQRFDVVTVAKAFQSLERDSASQLTMAVPVDDNVEVSRLEGGALQGDASWRVRSADADGRFVIVRAATFPAVLHPGVEGGAGGPRYVPAGKPALIQGVIVGPGGAEPLLLDGNDMTRLSESPAPSFAGRIEAGASGSLQEVRIQVGRDSEPLQIQRSFVLVPLAELPKLEADDPQQSCVDPCRLRVAFSPGAAVEDLEATVYILSVDPEGRATPLSSFSMSCDERECRYDQFKPDEGRAYRFVFLAKARSNARLFSDWAEAVLTTRPAVYVRGAPDPLDLNKQPEGGWPVLVLARTTEDLGRLTATITFTNLLAPDERIESVSASLSVDIRGQGEQPATLSLTGYEELPPGDYTGTVTFSVERGGDQVDMPAALGVILRRTAPIAEVNDASLIFDPVLFNPAPNFRIDTLKSLPIDYTGEPFLLQATIESTEQQECVALGLTIETDPAELDGSLYRLPLRLRSTQPLTGGLVCSGTFRLTPLDSFKKVLPDGPLTWSLRVESLVWEIVGAENERRERSGNVTFSEARTSAEESVGALLVRYPGGPEFALLVAGSLGAGSLTAEDVTIDPAMPETTGEDGVYQVRLRLKPQHDLAGIWWFGGHTYRGELRVTVKDVPSLTEQTIAYSLYSPTMLERRLWRFYTRFPWPAIGMWLFTATVLVVGLLVMMARARRLDWERKQQESPMSVVHKPDPTNAVSSRPPSGAPPLPPRVPTAGGGPPRPPEVGPPTPPGGRPQRR